MRDATLFVLVLMAPALSAAPLRPEIRAHHGVVAAGRSYSAEAGALVMSNGGNAIDAGVATVFAAAVCEISHFGFGGEAPILIYSAKSAEVVVINGQGPAPKAATVELFKGKKEIEGNGPLGATIPAVVDSLAIALERYGTKSLGEVLAPAIALADGFPMYEFLRRNLIENKKYCEAYPWTMKTYYPGERMPEDGELFRQPNLARTLRALAEAERAALAAGRSRAEAIRVGRDAFYKGDLAHRIVKADREAGGMFSDEDLGQYAGRVEKAYSTTYRGYQVFKAGPWNQSPALLETLNLLEGFDLKSMGHLSADALHTLVESIKLAYADRDRYYGDPDFVQVPMRGLLSKAYAAERRKLIDPARASLEQRPGDPQRFEGVAEVTPARAIAPAQTRHPDRVVELGLAPGCSPIIQSSVLSPQCSNEAKPNGDTTSVQVADAQGNLFSATPSSGWVLGGAFIAGDTGVPLSNRMQAFRLDPDSPNVLAGGKRPRTTLTPTIVLKDDRPFLAIGTPGGDSQDQQILNVLVSLLDYGLDVQAAIEAPRVNSLHPQSSFNDHRAQPGVLEAEATLGPAVLDELRRRGHKLQLRGAYGISTGVVAAGVDPVTGLLRGGADPRRERYVVAW